jgi:hypothetical protein
MLILERSNLKLEWLEEERVLRKTCLGHVASGVLREVYDLIIPALLERGGTRILSDNRGLLPTPQEDLDWVEQDWFPRAVAAGWSAWAVLPPRSALGTMTMRRWIRVYQSRHLAVEAFEREEDALAWLQRQR